MATDNEQNPQRRLEDRLHNEPLNWPRFNSLGIAETWSVTVEAEGQRVLCIGHDHYAGLIGPELEQFAKTVDSCGRHLIAFIGGTSLPDWIKYDFATDTIEIHGFKYSGQLFRDFAFGMNEGQAFRIARRTDGVIWIERAEQSNTAGAARQGEALTQAEVDDMAFGYCSRGGQIGELRELIRAVESVVASRCRVQGGITNEKIPSALATQAQEAAPATRPTDDHLWDETLRDRDTYHEWADKLANAIAKHFGAEIGEHSNMNCPWTEALEVIEQAEESPQAKLNVAIKWINDAPHGDNCFVSNHYEGDPGNRCNCGKDGILSYLESDAAQVEPVAIPAGYVLVPEVPTDAIVCAIEAEIDSQLQASGLSPLQMQRQDGADIYEAMLAAAPAAEGGATSEQHVPSEAEQQSVESKLYLDLTQDAMKLGHDGIPAALEALRKTATSELPAILFDGKAVYDEIVRAQGSTVPEVVASTLDAVVRLMRKERGAAPSEQLAAPEQQLQRMRAAFHINMMRAYPGKTHDEIAAEIDKACGAGAPAGKALAADLIEAGALRQLRHNDETPGFVFAYDKDITDRVLARLATPTEPQGAARDTVLAEVIEDAREGIEILDNLIASVEKHGNYSPESTVGFLNHARTCFLPVRNLKANDKGADQAEKGGAS